MPIILGTLEVQVSPVGASTNHGPEYAPQIVGLFLRIQSKRLEAPGSELGSALAVLDRLHFLADRLKLGLPWAGPNLGSRAGRSLDIKNRYTYTYIYDAKNTYVDTYIYIYTPLYLSSYVTWPRSLESGHAPYWQDLKPL